MSTEPEPPVDEDPPTDSPTPGDPTERPPLPPAPELPNEPITFAPNLWYTGQVTCLTVDKGDGEPCVNAHRVWQIPRVWSNTDGSVWAQDAMCGQWVTFLSAEVLDPQPTEA